MSRALVLLVAAAVALSAAACSVDDATSNVATLDASAVKACTELRDLGARASTLSAREIRDRIGQVYADAQKSANPVLQARAVALYTDATYLAEGAPPGSFHADLAAMEAACRSGPA
jgi:hypothetical protein